MSTSKLQEYTSAKLLAHFGHMKIYENHRPDWLRGVDLERLELDFYIPEIKTAIEVQGSQHYIYSEYFFGSIDEWRKQLERDRQKKSLCDGKGITLFEVSTFQDVNILVADLKEKYLTKDFSYVPLDCGEDYRRFIVAKKLAAKYIRKINKNMGTVQRANSHVAKLLYQCYKNACPIDDPLIEAYYRENKQDIDRRFEDKIKTKMKKGDEFP